MSNSTEMVERVARAIWDASPGFERWDDLGPVERHVCFGMARAAIEAMREPTKPMVFFGMDAMCRDDLEPTEDEFRSGFVAAIDCALRMSLSPEDEGSQRK